MKTRNVIWHFFYLHGGFCHQQNGKTCFVAGCLGNARICFLFMLVLQALHHKVAGEKQPTLIKRRRHWFPARRNSTLMTPHNPDLGSASDWLKQISHTALSILPILRRSSALVSQTLFRGETSGGVGLDPNITKNRPNIFPEIPDFFLNISKISGFMS